MYRNWKVGNGTGYGHLRGVQVVDHRGLVVAVAIGDVPELDPDATAQLLAAAPAMMTALQGVARIMTWNECARAAPQIRQTKAEISNLLDMAISIARAALSTQVQS